MKLQASASIALLALAGACSHSTQAAKPAEPAPAAAPAPQPTQGPKTNDARVGLKPGKTDAGQALENAQLMANVPTGEGFNTTNNSDLAFTGKYAVQGNYYGFQIYDVSNPAGPKLVSSMVCPASQNDVSVYRQQLLFMSAEAPSARLDCGTQGVTDTVSKDRVRGIRIFDITDIAHPRYITSVQTCRGSHTHTVLEDPKDKDNVYIYVSGSSSVRPEAELSGCQEGMTTDNPNTALFRVEIIKVPVAHPEQAAIASTARIFQNLNAVGFRHGDAPADIANAKAALDAAKAGHGFVITMNGQEQAMPAQMANPLLDSVVRARGGSGGAAAATTADSAALRAALPRMTLTPRGGRRNVGGGPNQCHDITLYPAAGIGGGACQGYGILLDIRDPLHPQRLNQVNDSNFAAWHSVTFNNDGTKILFSDEWGGGSSPKCRASDPKEWGADAIFTLDQAHNMKFQSYYKLSAPQTEHENCVAHNGSLIPIPDRDVMVQAWYQGGISIFDWTDAKHVKEIAYFDRGPIDTTKRTTGGSWSAYWYNGNIYSSEIARGFDVVDLTPSEYISENELMAAKSVKWDYLNVQGQPKIVWPPSFALACSYLDQLDREKGLGASQISAARGTLAQAQNASGDARRSALTSLASDLNSQAASAADGAKVRKLAGAVSDLASGQSAAPCARKVS
jgi:hypothetical protein